MPSLDEMKDIVERMQREVDKAKQLMTQFDGAVNELNNLLAVMHGNAQLAQRSPTAEAQSELINVVLASTARARIRVRKAAPSSPTRRLTPYTPTMIKAAASARTTPETTRWDSVLRRPAFPSRFAPDAFGLAMRLSPLLRFDARHGQAKVGVAGVRRKDVDDLSLAHDDDPVADGAQLLQLGGDHDDGDALLAV
jgi:hypothetical protein